MVTAAAARCRTADAAVTIAVPDEVKLKPTETAGGAHTALTGQLTTLIAAIAMVTRSQTSIHFQEDAAMFRSSIDVAIWQDPSVQNQRDQNDGRRLRSCTRAPDQHDAGCRQQRRGHQNRPERRHGAGRQLRGPPDATAVLNSQPMRRSEGTFATIGTATAKPPWISVVAP